MNSALGRQINQESRLKWSIARSVCWWPPLAGEILKPLRSLAVWIHSCRVLLRSDLWIHVKRLALNVRTRLQRKMHKNSWCHARIWDGWGVRIKASQGYQAVMSPDTKAKAFRARFVAQLDVLLFQIWVFLLSWLSGSLELSHTSFLGACISTLPFQMCFY